MKKLIFLTIILANNVVLAQDPNWQTTGNNIIGSRWIGTNNPFPFRIYTNGTHKASFTYDGTEYADGSSGPGNGLRIFNQTNNSNPIGVLDLLTSGGNKTHVGFGRNGSITGAGTGNRMEYYAAGLGFWFNAQGGRAIWTINGTENARMGVNSYWRFGANGSSSDATRRVEIVDGNQQLRLKQATGAGFAEFYVRPNGRLLITPSGNNTGFTDIDNLTYNPTERIDVDGTARFRNVPTAIPDALFVGEQVTGLNDLNVRRLDFTGNANDVLQGNGTWGTGASPINANNGITLTAADEIQIGEVYNTAQTVPLLNNREVRMNNKHFVFSRRNIGNTGKVGIGLIFPSMPSQRLDVDGNARIRTLPLVVNQAAPIVDKVVMVDSTGVLKWKDASTFGLNTAVNGAWINPSNVIEWGTNPLIHDTEIPMTNFNVAFTSLPGSPTNTNNVKIGGNSLPVPFKLAVLNDVEDIGALVVSNSPVFGGTSRYGVFAKCQNSYISTGVAGFSAQGVQTIGTLGNASNGSMTTMGVKGSGTSSLGLGGVYGGYFTSNSNTIDINFGVAGFATGSPKTNIGGYFIGTEGTTAIGVYGEASSTTPGANVWAGYFAGPTISLAPSIPSDIQFKTNINGIQDANSILDALNPVTYDFLHTGNAQYMHFSNVNQYGLIAQEVEQVLPELINNVSHPEQRDSLGNITVPTFDYKTLNYEAIIPILVKGHKEQNGVIESQDSIITAQQTEIDDLNDRLTQLENCLSGILPFLCQMNNSSIQPTQEVVQEQLRAAINVNLSDRNSIVLNQNVPNPFAESTIITFSIPTSVQKAQIHFYDGQGKLINSVDIVERGNGQLNVFANDLSTGVYTYSLVADGQIVSTKRMVKE